MPLVTIAVLCVAGQLAIADSMHICSITNGIIADSITSDDSSSNGNGSNGSGGGKSNDNGRYKYRLSRRDNHRT